MISAATAQEKFKEQEWIKQAAERAAAAEQRRKVEANIAEALVQVVPETLRKIEERIHVAIDSGQRRTTYDFGNSPVSYAVLQKVVQELISLEYTVEHEYVPEYNGEEGYRIPAYYLLQIHW